MKHNEPTDEYDYYCTDCQGIISPKDKVCPHCRADTSEFIEEEEDSFDELDEEISPKKYPALRVIATLYQAIAVVIAIVTLISFLLLLQQPTSNPVFSIGSLVLGMIGVITFLALSEAIKVFIDIEHGIRGITRLLKRRETEEED